MTAIIDRNVIDAAQGAGRGPAGNGQRPAATAHRRGTARARGVSPRLAHARATEVRGESITVSNETPSGAVRTPAGPVRIAGARGASSRSVERIRVRPAGRRAPRGSSRVDGCARRTPRATVAGCVLAAVGAFVGVLLLFGGSPQTAEASSAPEAAVARPAATQMITVRAGQSLEQIAAEVAPGRAPSVVAAEITEINGLDDGRVLPGQTLVTPRS